MADNVVSVTFNGIDNLSSKTNSIAGSFTELNSMVSLAKQGIAAAQQVYQATIGTTLQYADAVRQMSLVTGMSTEQSSRFLEIADKTNVSVSELQMGLKYMAKNGVEPTIQGIAALSDKFLSLKPGIEQDNFLIKNFGRSGMDMALLMSQGSKAIDVLSASTNKNLILTQKQVDAARENEIATKELADVWKGFTVELGNATIPALTDVLKGTLNLTSAYELATEKGHTFHTSNAMMYDGSIKVAQAYQAEADGLNKYIDALDRESGRQKPPETPKNDTPTIPGQTSGHVDSITQQKQKIDSAAGSYLNAQSALEKYASTNNVSKKQIQEMSDAIDKTALSSGLTKDQVNFLKENVGQLATATSGTKKPFNDMTGDMTAADLEAMSARGSVSSIISTMHNLDGMTADVYITVHTSGGLGGLTSLASGGQSHGGSLVRSAGGADFIVPPGYSKDSYPMFVQSGEHVQVTPAGGSDKGGGKVFNNYGEVHFHLAAGADMAGAIDYVGI